MKPVDRRGSGSCVEVVGMCWKRLRLLRGEACIARSVVRQSCGCLNNTKNWMRRGTPTKEIQRSCYLAGSSGILCMHRYPKNPLKTNETKLEQHQRSVELSGTYGAQMATEGARTAPTASTECWRVNKRKRSARKGPKQTCVLACLCA